jgi:hypothetical protein
VGGGVSGLGTEGDHGGCGDGGGEPGDHRGVHLWLPTFVVPAMNPKLENATIPGLSQPLSPRYHQIHTTINDDVPDDSKLSTSDDAAISCRH